MKNHVQIIAALLERGWELRYVNVLCRFEWRQPDGISGSTYQTPDLSTLPKPVEEWIRNNDTIHLVQALMW